MWVLQSAPAIASSAPTFDDPGIAKKFKKKEIEVFLFISQAKLVLLSSAQLENSQEIRQGCSRMQGQHKLILLFETGRKEKRVGAPGLRLPAQSPVYFLAEGSLSFPGASQELCFVEFSVEFSGEHPAKDKAPFMGRLSWDGAGSSLQCEMWNVCGDTPCPKGTLVSVPWPAATPAALAGALPALSCSELTNVWEGLVFKLLKQQSLSMPSCS